MFLLLTLALIIIISLFVIDLLDEYDDQMFCFFFTFIIAYMSLNKFWKIFPYWSEMKIFFPTWKESYIELINDKEKLRDLRKYND